MNNFTKPILLLTLTNLVVIVFSCSQINKGTIRVFPTNSEHTYCVDVHNQPIVCQGFTAQSNTRIPGGKQTVTSGTNFIPGGI